MQIQQSYEELSGGTGRKIFFRSPRYIPKQFSKELILSIQINQVLAKVHNFSLNGFLASTLSQKLKVEKDFQINIKLLINHNIFVACQAKVVRYFYKDNRLYFGATLENDFIDEKKLRSEINRLSFQESIENLDDKFNNTPESYRSACSELIFFLNYWKVLLDNREKQLLSEETESSDNEILSFEMSAEQIMRKKWHYLRKKIDMSLIDVYKSDKAFKASKYFTETQISPLLKSAPLFRHSYLKPGGYPGDYIAMNYMYSYSRIGKSTFGRIMHQFTREEPLAITVNNRKDYLIDNIRKAIEKKSITFPKEEIRIMSLGSGPAKEVEEYLSKNQPQTPTTFTIIDQDQLALKFATDKLSKQMLRKGNKTKLNPLFISFRQLLNQPRILKSHQNQDLIYCAGLLDYLPKKTAQEIIFSFFNLLAPNGTMIFGNAAKIRNIEWMAEFALDWQLNYRTEAEVRELGALIENKAQIKIEYDSSEVWIFLVAKQQPD